MASAPGSSASLLVHARPWDGLLSLQKLSYLRSSLLSNLDYKSQRRVDSINCCRIPSKAHSSNFIYPPSLRSGRAFPLVLAKKKAEDDVAVSKKGSGKKNKETNGHAGNGPVTVGKPPPVNGNGELPTFEVPNFTGVEARGHYPDISASPRAAKGSKEFDYEKEMERLQLELVKLQEWIRKKGLKVVVLFEGRDAAGKGGMIKTITAPLNPRVCYVRALGTPSDRERTQWYFQRYVAQLPAGGEMAIFDRSWYNRAGVEKVMGFCTNDEYIEFLRSCPEFERMLVRSGIILLKYWISVSPEEQEKRFKERLRHPEKRWKLSTMDLYSRSRWSDYSYAKDIMFSYTDIKQAPWYVIPADDKKAARLNCISHMLSKIPYENLIPPDNMDLPPLQEDKYVRPPMSDQTFVPLVYH